MLKQRLMWTAWPSFLMAGILEIAVFGLVDPEELKWFGSALTESRQAIYAFSFFAFWFIAMLSSSLTLLLSLPPIKPPPDEI